MPTPTTFTFSCNNPISDIHSLYDDDELDRFINDYNEYEGEDGIGIEDDENKEDEYPETTQIDPDKLIAHLRGTIDNLKLALDNTENENLRIMLENAKLDGEIKTLHNTVKELQSEIKHLKITGVFPKEPNAGLSNTNGLKRFSTLDLE
jgi:dynactin complex subunit